MRIDLIDKQLAEVSVQKIICSCMLSVRKKLLNYHFSLQVSRVTDRWKEDNEDIRESLGDVEDSVGRVEEDCKAKGMQIDVLSDQGRR